MTAKENYNPDEKVFEALAHLEAAFDDGLERLQHVKEKGISLPADIDIATLLEGHRAHFEIVTNMTDTRRSMANSNVSYAQWANRTIDSAIDPTSGLDENPMAALQSSENRIRKALDEVLKYTPYDPDRGLFERMKFDTATLHKRCGLDIAG